LTDDTPYFPDDIEPANSGEKQSSPNRRMDDPVLSYMRTNDSERENEELRGIIDDLTLDIKRLKQKLRRYKERDPPRLQGDKLFDVRTYGLPRRRKRQLERILQQFATDISATPRFSRDKTARTKSKHMRDKTPASEDDARKALVAMLLKQHLSFLAAKANSQHLANTSPSSNSWYDLNEMLSTIKHMITNIDVDFSREALREYGTALELAADGHRVRWQTSNGQGLTRSHTGSTVLYDHLHNHQMNDLPRKESIHHEIVLGLAESDTTSLHKPAATNYVPYILTTHANGADDDIQSIISSGSEMSFQACASDRRGDVSVTQPQAQKKFQDRLTYYKNATFYIDCFGDSPDITDSQPRKSSWIEGVGEKRKRSSSPSLSQQQQRRYTNQTAATRFLSYPNEKDSVRNLSQCSSPVLSLVEEPLTSVADGHKAFPMELAASGVGDVAPEDNFAVHVVMKHVPVSSSDDTGGVVNNGSSSNTNPWKKPGTSRVSSHDQRNGRINNRNKKLFKTYVVTATHEELAPSSLPPATCGFFSSASSDDDSDDDEDELDGIYEKQGQVNLVDVTRDVLARVGVIDGESPASVHSIEKWNAQVVASLGNHEENGVFP
jgi:hypothetical protein